MEAIGKRAKELRDKVAKQEQAVFSHFTGIYGGPDDVVADEVELLIHQRLEKFYISTRAGKHFQRDIARGIEDYIIHGCKLVETGTKISEDCKKYGSDNTCTCGTTLSLAAHNFSRALAQMERERGNLLKTLYTQVAEPLRAMVMGSSLEDARQLARRYDRVRQEAETQAADVSRRRARVRETMGNPDNVMNLEVVEAKLQELKSNMAQLGKEATSAIAAVEGQQQIMTLQRLCYGEVESKRDYHQRVLQILDQLDGESFPRLAKQRLTTKTNNSWHLNDKEPKRLPPPSVEAFVPPPPLYEEVIGSFPRETYNDLSGIDYFVGEVMYSFKAVSDAELSLSTGEYVVVRMVLDSGWAEGECRGKAGWFPVDYVKRRERVPETKTR